MVGRAAAKVLRTYGAVDAMDMLDTALSRVAMHLPLKTFKCVRQWPARSKFDSDYDIRNNMIGVFLFVVFIIVALRCVYNCCILGDKHAAAIIAADVIADSVLEGILMRKLM